MDKSLKYIGNEYCNQPIHTIKNNGRPVKISKSEYLKKHCRQKKGNKKCNYLVEIK